VTVLPESASTYSGAIDSLGLMITIIVGICLLIAEIVLLIAVIRFRRKEDRPAAYIRGECWKQLKWIILPVLVVAALDLFIDAKTHATWVLIKGGVPPADQTVRVVAQQYYYSFTHAGPDGQLDTADDIETINEWHVPVDANVVFELEAVDVLHSLWIPVLRLKQDALPGRTITGWFNATKPGDYEIACAELCGAGHSIMRATLHVHTPEQFEQWRAAESGAGDTDGQSVPKAEP
jgi:cytochrome c oxidase subunit 2